MSALTEAILTSVLAYGPPALLLGLLLVDLGVPLPGSLLLLAAGAFVRQGALDGPLALGMALVGAALGDSGSYAVGRYGGALVRGRLASTAVWQRAQATFDRWGGLAIVLTRFLLTPLCVPVSVIAGSTGYPYRRFLPFDLAGELIWVSLYMGLGFVFAGSWEALSDLADNLAWLLAGVAVMAGGTLLGWRVRSVILLAQR
jgi:membrane-associated protein